MVCRVLCQMIILCTVVLLAGNATAGTASAAGPARLKALLIDGQNNHNWRLMTPYLQEILERSGRFTVEVATTPTEKNAPEAEWAAFRPQFADFDVVISNYNGELWPRPVQEDLERYVSGGGGLVIVHAANNAFPEWPAWNQMIGLGWRRPDYGPRLTLDEDGKPVLTPAGEGPGAGHGPVHPFPVVTRDRRHPVMQGLPAEWMHATDELYHGQRGPAQSMNILATAYSSPEQRGTGAHEPMIWWIPFGRGKVFTTLLGHVGGRSDDLTAIRCLGFQTTFLRGTEWVATGAVTIPVPENFPTAKDVRLDDQPAAP